MKNILRASKQKKKKKKNQISYKVKEIRLPLDF